MSVESYGIIQFMQNIFVIKELPNIDIKEVFLKKKSKTIKLNQRECYFSKPKQSFIFSFVLENDYTNIFVMQIVF